MLRAMSRATGMTTLSLSVLCASLAACRAILGIDDPPVEAEPPSDAAIVEDDAAPHDAGPRFCDTVLPKPAFCADFEGESLTAGFINDEVRPDPGTLGGGTIGPQAREPHSGLRAAELAIPALVTRDNEAAAFLFAYAPVGAKKLLVKLALRVDTESFAPDGGAAAIVFSLEFGRAVGRIWLLRTEKGMRLQVFDALESVEEQEFAAPFPAGRWKTITLLVSNYPVDGGADAGAGRVDVLVDSPVASLPLPASYQEPTIEPLLHVGTLLARGPMGPFTVSVDDVWMRVLP